MTSLEEIMKIIKEKEEKERRPLLYKEDKKFWKEINKDLPKYVKKIGPVKIKSEYKKYEIKLTVKPSTAELKQAAENLGHKVITYKNEPNFLHIMKVREFPGRARMESTLCYLYCNQKKYSEYNRRELEIIAEYLKNLNND